MHRKRILWIAGLLCLLAALILVVSRRDKAPAETPRTAAVIAVTRDTLASSLTIAGQFQPYQEVDLHAKVSGYIRWIKVDIGDRVHRGEVLATLEVPELMDQLQGAQADVRHSQSEITRAQSEVVSAQSTYSALHAQYTRLAEASKQKPGLIAEQELDDSMAKDRESEAQTESARATLSESQSQLAVAQADLDRLSALEAYSHITAPFAGVVTKRYADTGALIQAGTASETQSMPVVQLAEWSRLRLVVPVPESAVPGLQLGSVVQVHVSAMNRDFGGKVARFADSLNEETRTMHTEIDVENTDGTLKDGMYAEAKITLQQQNNVLTVPIQALDRTNSGVSVLIVDGEGHVELRPVKLGVEGSNRVEVVSGLAENDRVIIGNRGQLHPGEKVSPKVVNENNLEAEGS